MRSITTPKAILLATLAAALGTALVHRDAISQSFVQATQVRFKAGATGAVLRALDLKLADAVSVKDFGAVGNGAADDTAALNAAFAAGGRVLVPSGTYLFTALNTVGAVDLEIFCAHGAILKSNTTGTALPIDSWSSGKRTTVRGCKFSHGANTPAAFITVKGSKVTLSELDFSGTSATRGIDNVYAYRTTIERVVFNVFTGTPIYLEESGFDATFSYSIAIRDLELSNITGTGMVIEGGSVNLTDSVVESCSAGGILVSSNFTTFPLMISGLHMEVNTGFDIKLDSDWGTGTRWAHVSIDGAHIVNPAGFVFNGRGYLHMRNVEGISGTLNITQLHTMTAADSFLWIEGGRNYAVQSGVNFGVIEQPFATGILAAPKMAVSSATPDAIGLSLNGRTRVVLNADGDSTAWFDYDNVSAFEFNKRLRGLNTVASTNGFFVADTAVSAVLRGAVANGATAIGTILNNNVALTTAGAEITEFQNNGVRKAGIDLNGKYVVPTGGAADVAGRATLVAGTKTVSTTAVTAVSVVKLTTCVGGGTLGLPVVGTVTAGTSFVINSVQPGTASTLQAADTSTICWQILN